MFKIKRIARKRVVKKSMASCIRNTVSDLFDDFWPELESELLYMLRLELDFMEEFKLPEKKKRCCLVACCIRIKGAYLYS